MAPNQSIKIKQRKPRFRRVSIDHFRLQDRDVEIIKQVYKHRFLNSEHIRALVPGSNQVVLRRLQVLYHGGYLDRPREQIERYQSGSRPMIYGLGNNGAKLLAEEFNIDRTKVDWTSKNRDVQKRFLQHTLLVAQFMVCLDLACRQRENIRMIEPEEILANAPEETRKRKNPYILKIQTVKTIQGHPKTINIGVIPDKMFGLHFADQPEGRNMAYFFLEGDRATMPVIRSNLIRSAIYKKLLGYYIASPLKEGVFEKNFGLKNARVLFITKDLIRVKDMVEANKKVDHRRKGIGMFLFTQTGKFGLNNPQAILEKIWLNGRGEPAGLLD